MRLFLTQYAGERSSQKRNLFFKRYLLVSLLFFAGTIWAQDPSGNLTHSWTFESENAADMVGAADGILSGNAAIATTSLGDKGAVLTGGSVDLDAATIAINTYEEPSLEAWFTPDGTQAGTFTMVAYLGGTQGGSLTADSRSNPLAEMALGEGQSAALITPIPGLPKMELIQLQNWLPPSCTMRS